MAHSLGMHSWASRQASFQQPHQIAKRRASSQKGKGGKQVVEWPHESPSISDLARAGFFYRPAQDSLDNVQCFMCTVKLDGWTPSDAPLSEHLVHSSSCAWAIALSVARNPSIPEEHVDPETRDPFSDEMVAVRKATFDVGEGWPHESKKGWRCKADKMVAAGWAHDPSPEADDGATCFYCDLSLDGWEPKDDPYEEHRRRSPECRFFELVEHYHSADTRSKGKRKGRGSASTTGRASRISLASIVSGFVDAQSVADLGTTDDERAAVDDSIITTGTVTSQAGGKSKRAARSKAAPKGTKGKKIVAAVAPDESMMEVQYPDLTQATSPHARGHGKAELVEDAPQVADAPPPVPAKSTRRKGGARTSKQIDSSTIDTSTVSEAMPKKATRGRKAKVQPLPENEDPSEVSAQLQEELEHSLQAEADMPDVEQENTPQAEPQKKQTKGKRGVKRTSDGVKKQDQGLVNSSIVTMEFPVPPKAKGGNSKPRKAVQEHENSRADSEVEDSIALSLRISDPAIDDSETFAQEQSEIEAKPATKGKRGRSKKVSTESSGSNAMNTDVEALPVAATKTNKRGRPKKVSAVSMDIQQDEPLIAVSDMVEAHSLQSSEPDVKSTTTKASRVKATKKGPTVKKGKGRKASESTRSSTQARSTRMSETSERDGNEHISGAEDEDMERDEREIEAELERIRIEQEAIAAAAAAPAAPEEEQSGSDTLPEAPVEAEWEPTPSHRESKLSRVSLSSSRKARDIISSPWQEAETSTPRPVQTQAQSSPRSSQVVANTTPSPLPSPAGSDKENQPSSQLVPPTAKKIHDGVNVTAPMILSPSKTVRVPLAPGTPNRSYNSNLLGSPSRLPRPAISPSKQTFSRLISSHPWEPIDLDTILLSTVSAEPSPGKIGLALAQAAAASARATAGTLTVEESSMTVEQWIRWRAEAGERELRRRCEELVGVFEREGNKALRALEGVEVVVG